MDYALEVNRLTVSFGGLVAVDDATMNVGRGHIHGLIGPNGAGKTTFLNALSGLVRPSSGSVRLNGTDISAELAHRRAMLGLARTFQHLQLMEERTVLENILVGLHGYPGAGATFLSRRLSDEPRMQRAREIMQFLEFDVDAVALAPVGTLTLYQRRRVEIARAIALGPTLLLLDEPGAGLSPASLQGITRIVRTINTKLGTSIVLIEHVISLVMSLCSTITVLDKGRVLANGTPSEIIANPAVRSSYLGTSDNA